MPDSSPLPVLPLAISAVSAGLLSAGGLLAYSVFAPRCQFWAPVIRSIPQREGVALTFDDGPHPEFTPAILDHLAASGTKATFFVIGRHAREHPQVLRRIHAEGHAIGNHSFDHEHFGVNRNRAYWHAQVFDTQKLIADLTGEAPMLFRPPMGFKTWHIAAAAKEAGLPMIGWSVRGYDTRPVSKDALSDYVLNRTSGHDILLLHDGIDPHRAQAKDGRAPSQQHTVDALPAILRGIREKNLQVIPLVEALVAGAEIQKAAAARVAAREGGTV